MSIIPSFIRFLVDSQMQINSQYGLFSSLHKLSFEEVLADIKHNRRIVFNNDFFFELLNTFSANNWCDIEELYFNLLLKCKSLEEVKKLNQEFDIIKKHLENYLNSKMKILEKINKIDTYCALFALLEDQNSLILNFNYTDTLKI